jgi:hypothetical protein
MCAISRIRRWPLLICVIAVVVAGCAGTPSPSFVLITINPYNKTPTPEPSLWSSGWGGYRDDKAVLRMKLELVAACLDGTPVSGAAPYGGDSHPLLVVDMNNQWIAKVDINRDFPDDAYGWSWPSPIQLVVCATRQENKVGSCGLYKADDGEVGEVVRYEDTMTFRVVVAQTGTTLQKKVITNPAPECPKLIGVDLLGEWFVKNRITDEQINEYATAVSNQP